MNNALLPSACLLSAIPSGFRVDAALHLSFVWSSVLVSSGRERFQGGDGGLPGTRALFLSFSLALAWRRPPGGECRRALTVDAWLAPAQGTSIDQDSRFFNQEKKLLASMAFPKSFEQRVDLTKVQREVIGQWVAGRLTQLLGFEDDIVVSMVINLLEPKVDERLDPRQLQVAVTGFLGKDAAAFTLELWELLLSAQANPTGIPTAILDKKKQELERAAADKAKLRQVLDAKRAEAEPARRRRDAFGRDVKQEASDRGRPQDRGEDRRPDRPRSPEPPGCRGRHAARSASRSRPRRDRRR